MQPVRTLEDLLHDVTNSLSLISSHAQYLLARHEATAQGAEQLQVVYDEAERAAALLRLVPQGLARSPIEGTTCPGRDGARDPEDSGKGQR